MLYYDVLTRLIIEMASVDRNRGYRTSSFTILSNTSSSSSPGKGDYNESNKKILLNRLKNPLLLKTTYIHLTVWN